MIDTALAYLYKPLAPITKRIRIERKKDRSYDPSHVLVPEGFSVEVVATGLNAPVHCSFDDEGYVYVTESGHKIESKPRVLKVDPRTGEHEVFFDLPEDRWDIYGALTGTLWHDPYLYFSNTDTVSRLRPDGTIEDLVTDLPGRGDHQTNYPVLGPDGKIYWGQGTGTNTAVVGADNFAYEWMKAYPDFHDRPGQDIVLAGHNYEFQNVLGNITETVRTGGYVPFGTETHPGQVIKGTVKASGSVLRCNPDGTAMGQGWNWSPGGCATPTASPFTPTVGCSPPSTASTSATPATSSATSRTSTRSWKGRGTAGRTSPRVSGWMIRTGARGAVGVNRCSPSTPTPTRPSRS